MQSVPVIDLSDPRVRAGDADALAEMDAACRDHGFFIVTGHGRTEVINRMWAAAREFFEAPRDERLAILRTADKPLGYFDRELTKRKRDLKEVFDFMRPQADDKGRNQWPEAMPEFQASMDAFYEAMSDLAAEILERVCAALGVDSAQLPGDADTSNVRLNHYPVQDPLTQTERNDVNALGDMALHHHTDPGLITLLMQDSVGGLQAWSRADGWIDVPPRDDAIIVNLGDVLQAFSNDQYKAAVHRVLPMQGTGRYSTPYFYNPPSDAVIAPHPKIAGDEPVYRPFAWREFIQGRIDDNFQDLGEDDIQVSRFRIEAA